MSPHLRGLLFLAIIFTLVGALAGFFAATVSYLLSPYVTGFLGLLVLYLAADAHDTFTKLPFPDGEDEAENKKYINTDVLRFLLGGIALALGAGSMIVLAYLPFVGVAAITMATLSFVLMVAAAARAIAHLLP